MPMCDIITTILLLSVYLLKEHLTKCEVHADVTLLLKVLGLAYVRHLS